LWLLWWLWWLWLIESLGWGVVVIGYIVIDDILIFIIEFIIWDMKKNNIE
jgi:hypothetical protein